MCGIAGGLRLGRDAEPLLRRMIACVRHRGPDDQGTWRDDDAQVGLAHARLSIIDLSPAGHQPMRSATGRFTLVFNGEAYNHEALRGELERAGAAPAWRGHSDTETLLAGFEAWGTEATIARTRGMFALAVWDARERELVLARDRVGEKPLYYAQAGEAFVFASELPALRSHPAFDASIDRGAIALLMRHNCIPAPWSIYGGARKLLPGHLLRVRPGEAPRLSAYWDGRAVIEQAQRDPFRGSPDEAVNDLEALLADAVRGQMMSDVPLGAFLSGGIDSSTVVALMQRASARPVRTFTIGFREERFDEATHARAVAAHLGTDHTELYVTPQDALAVIPRIAATYGEPFADSSQVPTLLVSELTRQHVTVALSGDGGDELFAGYNRYALTERLWGTLSRLPRPVRAAVGRAVQGISPRAWNGLAAPFQPLVPKRLRQANPGDKIVKGASVLAARSVEELYVLLTSHWHDPSSLVLGAVEPSTIVSDAARQPRTATAIERMMAVDLLTYLPDDLLVKVDRAAMSVSLETRVPLLDHRVVEFAWRLPLEYKLRDGVGKWPLRQLLARHVPPALFERPKMGFGVPIGEWLRGPLRDWAEALLDESRLRQEGWFDAPEVRRHWEEHRSGRRDWQYKLWDVLAFQAWAEAQR